MFQKDEYIFYESGGICKIEDIQTSPIETMPPDREYYVVKSLHDPSGVMFIPVDSDRVFLRRLLNREEALALLDSIPQMEEICEENGKLLRARYLDAMRTHDPKEWLRIIKTVRSRTAAAAQKRSQRISETERTLSDSAKRYLHAELSLALGIPESGMEAYITEHLAKMA